ncbi:hypothetical protein QBC40DRAFT_108562 [Triangularia verruculosa]|uniref:Secreted protein n=1 Tax=Triangularia verruculosa TaxID=2587418 RepID=A0AAN6XCH6_9PEZI|nr:hypothetical protein QBC40DRAFT_108562 [Triangularia verruculosa]
MLLFKWSWLAFCLGVSRFQGLSLGWNRMRENLGTGGVVLLISAGALRMSRLVGVDVDELLSCRMDKERGRISCFRPWRVGRVAREESGLLNGAVC